MNDLVPIRISQFLNFNPLPAFGLAIGLFCLLALFLSFGRRLQPAILLERLGIPIALLVGFVALLIGPFGKFPLLSQEVTEIWVDLPTPLLTLVFASLMLGRPIPSSKGLWKPVASQAVLGLLLGIGQYFVGGLVVLFVLIPLLGVNPLMGCLIEVGFEGGHGAAAIMGDSFFRLGYPEGLDLGLAMATVGLLSSTVFGSALVVFGRWRGWVVPHASEDIGSTGATDSPISLFEQLRQLFVNLIFVGLAVLFGVISLQGVRQIAPLLGGVFEEVALVFPVFPLALLGSLFLRYILEVTENTDWISQLLQREIGTLATDLLIITAMASLNLPLLTSDWIPLSALAIAGLLWNFLGMFVFSRLVFREEWFERSIAEFGNASGVAASGILLLRLADPLNLTKTLPIFSIKQLLLQPLLSGGLITVIAPIAVSQLGLKGWTEFCGVLTISFICIAVFIQRSINEEQFEA